MALKISHSKILTVLFVFFMERVISILKKMMKLLKNLFATVNFLVTIILKNVLTHSVDLTAITEMAG